MYLEIPLSFLSLMLQRFYSLFELTFLLYILHEIKKSLFRIAFLIGYMHENNEMGGRNDPIAGP